MAEDAIAITYEQLIQLEYDFVEVEDVILRKQYALEAPLYKRRSDLVAKIPSFWALVLEQAPTEVDQYIQPSDSQIFADCLTDFQVERFEIDTVPRSFKLTFTFSSNDWFENTVLEKKFWYRRANDGWVGYVSEPVRINWKKDKDLTHGLTNAAADLYEAKQKKVKAANGSGAVQSSTGMPEYKALVKKLERHDPTSSGFFALFAFISERRYVTAEESVAATAAEEERRAKVAKGESVESLEEEDFNDEEDVEVCPHGADLALLLLEDVWPNAIKAFTAAQEQDDENMSELDFEEMDSESDEEVDIRALIKGNPKRKTKPSDGDSPPPMKSRKT
ncbi:hypothetical protein EJ08DRAFT_6356 [Tothia fuscella]|uniref:Nap family protein n=1 Tax=Tothia fuscella TaxID=1048955 RepID=A0A9P4P448_9PEZI|nr:hypothetical protein EJ08DRAFT_6356 [Tothia fuscella]